MVVLTQPGSQDRMQGGGQMGRLLPGGNRIPVGTRQVDAEW